MTDPGSAEFAALIDRAADLYRSGDKDMARIAYRAAIAERDDHAPPRRESWCVCDGCQTYLFQTRWKRLTHG